MKAEEYTIEPVPMFSGWVGSCLGPEPTKKVRKDKDKKKQVKEPFGFYVRSKKLN